MKAKKIFSLLLLAALLFTEIPFDSSNAVSSRNAVYAQENNGASIDPSQWVAVDGLGRTLPQYSDVGKTQDKYVGIFYWTWHYSSALNNRPFNLSQLMAEYPELKNDYNNRLWGRYSATSYFWNEPLFGYYTQNDEYVLRKHAELLADAGVDFVVFDCTNGDITWEEGYMNVLKVWSEAKEQGVNVPKFTFVLNQAWFIDGNEVVSESTRSSIEQLYNAIYRDGKYKDMWFYFEGKPLIMASKDILLESQQEIKDFFTFRLSVASFDHPDQTNKYWGWLHIYPQALYKREDGSVEFTTVGVAQNYNVEEKIISAMNNPHNMGRSYTVQKDFSYSYTYRDREIKVDSSIENSMCYGLNFQEQWDYAISSDPQIIFVTGWNEWLVSRHEEFGGVTNAFPDQFDDENSRDIEPSKGQLKDYYYYQLAANVRRFKGVSKPAYQDYKKTIDISGSSNQWEDPNIISYNHYTKNTYNRDEDGWLTVHYTNNTMRNDIKSAKVSYDDDNLYFYVETVDNLTAYSDEAWMRLLLDTGVATAESKDWEEYEYILNRTAADENEMTLERSLGGWNWETVGNIEYTVQENVLQVKIPRQMIGLTGESIDFNFKWCDNNLKDGDIMTLYTDGDSAPGARFAFHFTTEKSAEYVSPDVTDNGIGATKIIIICISAVVIVAVAAVLIFLKKKKKR